MRYQVPQFIEVEDKIFGPFTVKQFLYIIGTLALCYLIYHFLPIFIALPIVAAVGIFGAALSFYKINNKPFIYAVEAAVYYFFNSKLYIWKRVPKSVQGEQQKAPTQAPSIFVPRLSESKLKDLSWSLDVNEKMHGTIFSKETGTLESQRQRGKLKE